MIPTSPFSPCSEISNLTLKFFSKRIQKKPQRQQLFIHVSSAQSPLEKKINAKKQENQKNSIFSVWENSQKWKQPHDKNLYKNR
jgi:hypothetical protein